VAGKIEERRGLYIVEMIENTGLMTAQYGLGLVVADVSLMASEVDLGIAAKNCVYLGVGH
jgi:hypothetical protein